ncbi:pirin family protein [Laceyella putida]|uniref:Pirin family protein n=1 Tax=Laceyella putida TaxID=110101 RepID=A0ABW2RNP7_9BACL
MLEIIRSEERFQADYGWLKTKHSFSFGQYYDPDNLHFGALRVLNDDIVAPGTGFDLHPHNNMEIMTYVISGSLEHQDSMGHKEVIRAGEVQCMTAGTGIFHSETNPSDTEPVHLLQIWFYPNKQGLTPSYDQKSFPVRERKNKWIPIVTGQKGGDALHIHQDVNVQLATLESGKSLSYRQAPGRRFFLFVIQGACLVNGEEVKAGDSVKVTDLHQLTVEGQTEAHVMLMDLA